MTNISEFRGKTNDELKSLASSLKKELFNLRFQVASGELQNTARFSEVRKDVARVKTLITGKSPEPKLVVLAKSKDKKSASKKKATGE
jgi:large subunit ribosomal protein L29